MTHLPADKWGDAAVSWPDRFFRIRVSNDDDPVLEVSDFNDS